VVDALSFPSVRANEKTGGECKRETENRMRTEPRRCSIVRSIFFIDTLRASIATREVFQSRWYGAWNDG